MAAIIAAKSTFRSRTFSTPTGDFTNYRKCDIYKLASSSAAPIICFRLVHPPPIRHGDLLQLRTRIDGERVLRHRQHLTVPKRITKGAIRGRTERFAKRVGLAR